MMAGTTTLLPPRLHRVSNANHENRASRAKMPVIQQ